MIQGIRRCKKVSGDSTFDHGFFQKTKKKILTLDFLSLLTLKLVSTPITLVEMTLTFFIWTVGDNMGPYRVNIL